MPDYPASGNRNLAQNTSSDWSKAYTSFNGGLNNCADLGKVLTDGMQVGDTVKVRIVLKYTNIVPASGQTATIWMQGAGNVTEWGDGSFPYTSGWKQLKGTGEIVFESTATISAAHLKNAYWNWQFRTDNVASGSAQWKEGKVEIGNNFTAYTPAPEQMGWSTDTLVPTQEQRYLWKFEYVYYSDGSVEVTQPVNISIAGADGTNGQTSHVHFAFADNATGGGFSLTTPKAYMGWYADFNEAASTDPTKYRWGKWKGDQGAPGGGRNLIVKSTAQKGLRLAVGAEPYADQAHALTDWIKIEPSTVYTLTTYEDVTETNMWYSLAWYSSNVNDYSGWISRPTGAATAADLKNGRQYTSPANAVYAKVSYPINYPKVKFERGNVATDYSLAPEDTQADIDSKADSVLTQEQLNALEAKRLQMEVELKAKATLEQVSELETFINNLKQEDTDGRQKIIEITKAIEERVKDIEPIMEYSQKLKFMDTYITQGNGGMVIGANESTTKVVVTPDRISFQSGGSEVAYISQRMLNIDNGVFTLSLQLGHYITRAHPKNEYVNATYFVK